jgi:hypothetical protein
VKHLSSVTAATLVLGLAVVAAPATYAQGAGRATLRSVVAVEQLDLNGFGNKTDWYYHWTGSAKAEFQPHFAYYWTNHFYWQQGPSSWESGKSTFFVVGDHQYEEGVNGHWMVGTLPQSTLQKYAKEYNPDYGLNYFYSTPGVTKVGPGHYQATCTIAQAKAFWVNYLDVEYSWLADYGFKTVAINLWTDSSRRPLTITVSGRSSDIRLSYRATLSDYNKPLVIKSPA